MRLYFGMLVVVFIGLLTACSAPPPPETPPTDFSSPPALDDGPFAVHISRASFPGTISETRAFMGEESRLLNAMPNTEKIARAVGFEMLKGNAWPAKGAVRRLKFSDGHYAMERTLEFTPERFTYQVWDFTSATGKNVSYVYGVQDLTPNSAGGTDFTWTYNVRPNANWKRRFVQKFVDEDVSVLIDTATQTVEDAAAEKAKP